MRLTLLLILISICSLAHAVPAEVWCFADKKLIFHKKVDNVTYEKDVMVGHTKTYSYAIFNSDCIIKYKHKNPVTH